MRIVAIREQTFNLASALRNANVSFDTMTASAIAVHTDATKNGHPLFGLAFDSIGRYGHGSLLRERFIPRLLAAAPDDYSDGCGGIDPHRAWAVLMKNEKLGGHGERSGAVGLIDAALWDLAAKKADLPLWRHLGNQYGPKTVAGKLSVYASGGHYRGADDIDRLCNDIRRAIGLGHRRFKIKIGGATLARDVERIEAVFGVLESSMALAVDGNGTFDREKTVAYLDALKSYPIAWIEEPVHPLDFELHREIIEYTQIAIATGENLFSYDDARNLLRYSGLRSDRDFLQFDLSLSYGVVEYLRILENLEQRGWRRDRCAPHAGHLHAMNAVAELGLGLAEVAMDATTLFDRLTTGIVVADGTAILPDAPGSGFEQSPVFPEAFGNLVA